MTHPYRYLPDNQFWNRSVSKRSIGELDQLYQKKFDISPRDKIAAAGSCFAQHISRRLRSAGYRYLDYECSPKELPENRRGAYGYGMYSARYGNLYTLRQLLQLAEEAFGVKDRVPPVWERSGRFYDPLRPNVEPAGLGSPEEVRDHREYHLSMVRQLFLDMDVFIFTFGLTETWVHTETRRVLPIAPGVMAGEYQPHEYHFHNFTVSEMASDLDAFIGLLKEFRGRDCRFIFTVSPVPLAATAETRHVIVATTYSKSALRVVAGEAARQDSNIDYFPSYEIITSPVSRGQFYDDQMREVLPDGVDTVMSHFFSQHPPHSHSDRAVKRSTMLDDDEVVCEEVLLGSFAR